jgi:hypothetical protein
MIIFVQAILSLCYPFCQHWCSGTGRDRSTARRSSCATSILQGIPEFWPVSTTYWSRLRSSDPQTSHFSRVPEVVLEPSEFWDVKALHRFSRRLSGPVHSNSDFNQLLCCGWMGIISVTWVTQLHMWTKLIHNSHTTDSEVSEMFINWHLFVYNVHALILEYWSRSINSKQIQVQLHNEPGRKVMESSFNDLIEVVWGSDLAPTIDPLAERNFNLLWTQAHVAKLLEL